MISYKIDYADITKLARYYNAIMPAAKRAAAHALNTMGAEILDNVVVALADKYQQDTEEIRRRIVVSPADPHNLEWIMDASLVVAPSVNWNRPWTTRGEDAFAQDTLVNITTSGDESTCEVCSQVADDNPHTLQEVLDMQAKWADYVPPTPNIAPGVITNLIHPRCRCVVNPWSSYNRSTAGSAFQGSGNIGDVAPAYTSSQIVDMKKFSALFRQQMKFQMNMVKPK